MGCSEKEPVCPGEFGDLTEDSGIACADVHRVRRWAGWLAGRSLTAVQWSQVVDALASKAAKDGPSVQALLDGVEADLVAIAKDDARTQASGRVARIVALLDGEGPIDEDDWPRVTSVIEKAIAVWERDGDLVLTEMDVESWIRYVSLCREVQRGGPLLLSVADRVPLYTTVRERWKELDEEGRLALSYLGTHWRVVAERWQVASYERQQSWIMSAPLPPPMTATSLGYMEVVTEGTIARHVDVVEAKLGPIRSAP